MGGPKVRLMNPWALSEREVDVMDEITRAGEIGAVAARLKISKHTAYCYLRRAKGKMHQAGDGALVRAVVAFDRWRQTDGKGVPA
jgi:DNA-binding CsgD family transcriptional regulator